MCNQRPALCVCKVVLLGQRGTMSMDPPPPERPPARGGGVSLVWVGVGVSLGGWGWGWGGWGGGGVSLVGGGAGDLSTLCHRALQLHLLR